MAGLGWLVWLVWLIRHRPGREAVVEGPDQVPTAPGDDNDDDADDDDGSAARRSTETAP